MIYAAHKSNLALFISYARLPISAYMSHSHWSGSPKNHFSESARLRMQKRNKEPKTIKWLRAYYIKRKPKLVTSTIITAGTWEGSFLRKEIFNKKHTHTHTHLMKSNIMLYNQYTHNVLKNYRYIFINYKFLLCAM